MKENLRQEKGITLIALVITIIVLLILAIVTIRIMTNENIIGHANNAVTAYNEAQNNETQQLTWAEQLMQNKGGSSSSSSNNQIQTGSLSEITNQEIQEIIQSGSYDNAAHVAEQDDLAIAVNDNESQNPRIIIQKGSTEQDQSIQSIMIFLGDNLYVFTPNSSLASMFGVDVGKWYMASPSILQSQPSSSDFTEYTGAAPVSTSDFTSIYSQTLFNRILASFNS